MGIAAALEGILGRHEKCRATSRKFPRNSDGTTGENSVGFASNP